MKVLALDFDGVLVDSQYEALFTSFNAYLRANPKTKIFGGKPFICSQFEKIQKKYKKDFKEYLQLRPYVKSAEDYFFVLYSIDKGLTIKNHKEFNLIASKLKNKTKNFSSEFYKVRREFQHNDFDDWCRLSLPYKKIVRHYRNIRQFKIVIATNNEAGSIIKTLASFGLKINKEIIFDNETGTDKKEKLKRIAKTYGIGFGDLYFVDDQVESLIKAKELGVNCYLALWGYVTLEQKALAKKEGINLLSIGDFSSEFK